MKISKYFSDQFSRQIRNKSAVMAISLDWAAAFDLQDPSIAIQKFIKLGIRPSLILLLASYLTVRK